MECTLFYVYLKHCCSGITGLFLAYTERKKWSRNDSTVEPFSCPQDGPHLGTVLAPLCKVVPFSTEKG